jgi:hypothetical protein
MRARNIKPGFFTNEVLGTLDPIISLLFAGLWCLADKDGRLEDRPLRIKAELFPYREGLDVNGYLTVLERNAFITRYTVDGSGYIQIENFAKHQSPHHTEKPRGYPAKDQQECASQSKPVLTPLSNGGKKVSERSDSLIPDSLIPDSSRAPAEPDNTATKPSKVTLANLVDRYGVDSQVAADWLAVRKGKGAKTLTETAMAAIEREARKASVSVAEAIRIAAERGWQGFSADWLTKAPGNVAAALPRSARPRLNPADHDMRGQA